MKNNIIPPFVAREAGIRLNNKPKIQTDESNDEDHLIYYPETDFGIPLSMWGMLSYFITPKPTTKQMMDAEDVYLLTPNEMNPHCDTYTKIKENMLDLEGNMIQRKERVQILLSEIP